MRGQCNLTAGASLCGCCMCDSPTGRLAGSSWVAALPCAPMEVPVMDEGPAQPDGAWAPPPLWLWPWLLPAAGAA